MEFADQARVGEGRSRDRRQQASSSHARSRIELCSQLAKLLKLRHRVAALRSFPWSRPCAVGHDPSHIAASRLADSATDRVAKLPLSALYNQGGAPSLYVVDGSGSLALKPVTVKGYESDNVVITDGVDEGAKVVALGVQKLDPAQKVRVVSSLSF